MILYFLLFLQTYHLYLFPHLFGLFCLLRILVCCIYLSFFPLLPFQGHCAMFTHCSLTVCPLLTSLLFPRIFLALVLLTVSLLFSLRSRCAEPRGYAALTSPTAFFLSSLISLSVFTLRCIFDPSFLFKLLTRFASIALNVCIFGFLLIRPLCRKGKVCKTEPHLTLIRLLSL